MSSYQIYSMNLFSLSAQYINVKSLLIFSISADVSVCHYTDWSCVHTLHCGHCHSTFHFGLHTKAMPSILIY